MSIEFKIPKKLIEVALPLDAINDAAGREKSMRHGHPSALHLWWARRPLAAARAVIFAQMVNDPGYERHLGRGVNKLEAQKERERLFEILRQLVTWENINDESILKEARAEILKSWKETCSLNKNHPRAKELFNPDELPAFHDPFSGGGAIPLEAQRLGLKAFASDLNPVAVAINKAMIEIPFRFYKSKPIGPSETKSNTNILMEWPNSTGIAEDVKRYGDWVKEQAYKKIGNLYPKILITKQLANNRPDLKPLIGEELTVISWLWARTVKSPSPMFSHVDVPLVSTFILSSKVKKEAYITPVIKGDSYEFQAFSGVPKKAAESGTKASGRGANFICLLSGATISGDYIKEEGQAGRMGSKLLAIVAEGPSGRVFLSPTIEHETLAISAQPTWKPSGNVPPRLTGGTCVPYGLREWGDLFTKRQLLALGTFSELVSEAMKKCQVDASNSGVFPDDKRSLDEGGRGPVAYSQAIGVYLSFLVDQLANHQSTLCGWNHPNTQMRSVFSRQALGMTWDYAEANVFSESSGSFNNLFERQIKAFEALGQNFEGVATSADASTQNISVNKIISTDPPYYDNIAYADLSDFFYVWLQRNLAQIFKNLFQNIEVPKREELVATAYRHGGREQAELFFLEGMTKAISNLAINAHPAFPVTIYYAFKQSETSDTLGTNSTGWETFLEAILRAGFAVTGTWPMRTEKVGRSIGNGANALASSIVLVCQKRPSTATTISRREFIRELNATLPLALDEMTSNGDSSAVAPVDLSQAIIGPGMAIFSKYAAVLEADGKPMSVRTALQLINRFLAEDDFDHDTQFCLSWFEGHGWDKGKFGEADVLARAKGTSVDGLKSGGVIESSGGSVRLLRFEEYNKDWEPESDSRLSSWEILHHLIRIINNEGEAVAGSVLAKTNRYAESVRTLAYRLYTLSERKGWAQEASHYNNLVNSWTTIETSAGTEGYAESQTNLFGEPSNLPQTTVEKIKKTGKKK